MSEILVDPGALPRKTRDYLLHAARREPSSFPALVRCRDCVRAVPSFEGWVRCERWGMGRPGEWFCADGEGRVWAGQGQSNERKREC